MEALLSEWLREYGYVVLFCWSILEGELGLTMAGILTHTGSMNYLLAVFVAGLGAFTGDQTFFFIGRHNRGFIQSRLRRQRRKIALSSLLLKKYGWYVIFLQRYLYGLRTVIPLTIGVTNYPAGKFALINLLSAWVWAALIITPAYIYGAQILELLEFVKRHWFFGLPLLGGLLYALHSYLARLERFYLQKRRRRPAPE